MELMALAIIFTAFFGLIGWVAWLFYKSEPNKPESMYTWKKTTTYKPKEEKIKAPPSSPPSTDETETRAG